MAHNLKVLRVIKGGTISWNACRDQRDEHPRFDDRRDQRDERPRFDDRRDQRDERPRFDDRRDQRDERPRFDDRHDRRPRFDDRHGRDGPSPYYGHQRQDVHSKNDYTTRRTRAVSVERQ